MSFICVFVPSRNTLFLVDWTLLVKERIANIGIPLDIIGFLLFHRFVVVSMIVCVKKMGFWFFANRPTVHNGGVSGGRVFGVAVGVSDK